MNREMVSERKVSDDATTIFSIWASAFWVMVQTLMIMIMIIIPNANHRILGFIRFLLSENLVTSKVTFKKHKD